VAPNTIFTLGQPDPDTMALTLEEGQVWVNVEGLAPGEVFQVETPAAVASVRGTRFSVRVGPDGTTVVSTKVSTVTVTGGGSVVTVTAGLQTTVVPGEQPGAPHPMSPDEQIRWGMAAGSGLDVVLPTIGEPGIFGFDGYFFDSYDWSPGGEFFATSYYDAGTVGDYVTVFYDTRSGSAVTSTLPLGVDGVFFSPAGDGLAYQSFVDNDRYTQICTAGVDGTPGSCFGGDAIYGWPFWSPDGQWIAFYSDRDMAYRAGFDLYKARPDGSELSQLTFDGAGWYNIRQAWSPQGDALAFVHTDDYGGAGEVWVMNADGADARMLFDGIYGNGYDHLDWSPDGSSLAVPAADGGLYVVPVDGADPWLVGGTEGWACRYPTWAPTGDGWPLFFYGQDPQSGEQGLWYAPDAAGGPAYFADPSWGPAWSASGNWVAFGFADHSGDVPSMEVYLFQSQPDFWP
jgi:WD40 repeat protein